MSRERRRGLVERCHRQLSVARQCKLVGISRSSVYYKRKPTPQGDLDLMMAMDRQYLAAPYFGSRRMQAWLQAQGHLTGRKRVRRLMRVMGLEAIYQRPRTSKGSPAAQRHPYLLRGMEITRPDQVWAADITYIPMSRGFLYLVVIMDWHSRCVLAWRLSNTLDSAFCVDALEEALNRGKPEVFNTDQGTQFTGEAFTGLLKEQGIQISHDGKGRYLDNIFVERLWRSLKYEEVYLKAYNQVPEARVGIGRYLWFYNEQRPHQALRYRTPAEVYRSTATSQEAGLSLNGAPKLSN